MLPTFTQHPFFKRDKLLRKRLTRLTNLHLEFGKRSSTTSTNVDNNFPDSTSYQQGEQMTLFSLPYLVRRMIYDLLLVEAAPIEPDFLGIWPEERQSGDLHPSNIAICHVSRQAYQESTSIYYSSNHFRFDCGGHIREFVKDIQPVHTRSMKRLTIRRYDSFVNSCKDFGLQVGTNKVISTSWTKYFGGSSTTALLSKFHGLEELRFITIGYTDDDADNHPQKPSEAFMRSLAKRSRKLIHLRKIIIHTMVEDENLDAFRNFSPDFDIIPGWAHSGKYESYVRWDMCNVTEVLERVHEPWWPQDSKQRRGNDKDGDEVLEEAMTLFNTAACEVTREDEDYVD